MNDADDGLAVLVFVFIAVGLFAYVLLAVLAVAAVVGLLWGLWQAVRWLWDQWRAPSEMEQIELARDAAARELVGLRQAAVRDMVDIARGDVIEGTAREIERW